MTGKRLSGPTVLKYVSKIVRGRRAGAAEREKN